MPALTSDLPSLALICCPLRMPSNTAGLRVSRGPHGLPGRLAPSPGVQLLEAGHHGAAASPGEGRVCANMRLFGHKPASPEEMTSSWAGGFADRSYEGSVSSGTPPLRCSGPEGPQEPCRTRATAGHRMGAVGHSAENRAGTGVRCSPVPGRATSPGFPAPPHPAPTLPHGPSGRGLAGLCCPRPPLPT